MTPGLLQAPVSGIDWKWREPRVAPFVAAALAAARSDYVAVILEGDDDLALIDAQESSGLVYVAVDANSQRVLAVAVARRERLRILIVQRDQVEAEATLLGRFGIYRRELDQRARRIHLRDFDREARLDEPIDAGAVLVCHRQQQIRQPGVR